MKKQLSYILYGIISLFSACSLNQNSKREIADFEHDYKTTLNELTDSLLRIRTLDTTYFIEFYPGYNYTVRFEYTDSSGRRNGFIDINFILSKDEKTFFLETATDAITYSKKYNCFSLKPFYFKHGDNALLVVINYGQLIKKFEKINGLKRIYRSDNFYYYYSDAL